MIICVHKRFLEVQEGTLHPKYLFEVAQSCQTKKKQKCANFLENMEFDFELQGEKSSTIKRR